MTGRAASLLSSVQTDATILQAGHEGSEVSVFQLLHFLGREWDELRFVASVLALIFQGAIVLKQRRQQGTDSITPSLVVSRRVGMLC